MDKGFGIAALIVGLIAIITPVVSLYVSWLALILATVAALSGDRIYATATPIISAFNIIVLSPITMGMLIAETKAANVNNDVAAVLLPLTVVLFIAPFAGMFLHSTGRFALRQ